MKKIFVLLLFPVMITAQKNKPLFDTYMKGQANLYGFNGNVLVAQNGKVIYKRSFGYADYLTKKKLDNKSIFDCGSIAKEFTAVGILLLKDKGLVNYTDTLRKFFPELPYTDVTIQQLLTHTSGMPNGFALVAKFFDHNQVASNDDLIRLLAREKPPVLFKPGEDLMYSGTAFNLLASIIERVSGQPYKVYMDEKIFKPLGMKYSMVANGPRSVKNIPGYAYGYVYSDSLKKYIPADSLHTGWTSYLAGITGEGMIITTTGDLLIWDRALRNHRLLSATTQKEMLSLQAEKNTFPKVRFGYGIRVGKNDLGNYVFHNGYYPGYKSMLINYTEDDVTVAVLSNDESQPEFIADALASIALNKEVTMPALQKEVVTSTVPGQYVGSYLMRLGRPPYMVDFPVEFLTKNERLYIHPPGSADIELKPVSKRKFFFGDGTDQQIEFIKDDHGIITSIWHTAWGIKKEIKKNE